MANIALQSAATGLSALNTKLDVIANNLANVNTTGFKGSRVNFQDLLYVERAQPGVENSNGDQRPIGLYVGLGVKVSGTQLDLQQGSQLPGNEYDMLIQGAGFFRVQVEDNLGSIAYTRAGAFVKNSVGQLVMANDPGRRLVPEITIPDDATGFSVRSDGRIFITRPGQAAPEELGQIEITGFINPTGLRQAGQNLFLESAASGPPVTGAAGEGGRGTILGGFLEGSNVDPTRELIEMIRTQRAFEMNSNSIRAADETLRAIGQLRR